MASTYDIKDTVRVTASFTSTAGAAADPTSVRFFKKTPAGVVSSVTYTTSQTTIVRTGVGGYYSDIATTVAGAYEYRWTSSGSIRQSDESYFYVRPQRVPSTAG